VGNASGLMTLAFPQSAVESGCLRSPPGPPTAYGGVVTDARLQPVLPPHQVQLGLDTFGDITVDESGQQLSHAQVLRDVVEQGVLADEVGVGALGLGEHHRDDFAISAPEIVLAAIASRTGRLLLGTAVT